LTLGGTGDQKDFPSVPKGQGVSTISNMDGGNRPELNLNWPLDESGEAQDLNLPASLGPADLREKTEIVRKSQQQMLRCWNREPRLTKRMLSPATRGISIEESISEFLSRRWQGASLEEIRTQKEELITNKGHSDCYLDYRNFIEAQSRLL